MKAMSVIKKVLGSDHLPLKIPIYMHNTLICLTLSTLAFFQDFHKNSRSAMRNPANMPPIKTTNTPPTLVTPSAFAFLLFLLSSSLQAPPLFSFHHLVYNFDIFWFSWKNIISLDRYSFHGESVKRGKNHLNIGSSGFKQASMSKIQGLSRTSKSLSNSFQGLKCNENY